jgi:hypothetical protein
MLQPSARSPPSAKKNACTVSTDAITIKAAYGPMSMASIIPPPKCPLEPVPGIVKLIICAAKMKAPRTPMRGIIFSSISSLSFFAQNPRVPNVPAQKVAPTAGESNASAICITISP